MDNTNIKDNFLANLAGNLAFNSSLTQTGLDGCSQNEEALECFKKVQAELNNILICTSSIAGIGFTGMPWFTLFGATGAYIATELSIPIDRLVSVMEMLLEEFNKEGITITPRVKTDKGIIDLFVKTSDRRRFAFIFRSNGDSKVIWNETRQEFFTNRKGGVSKWSKLKLLGEELNDGVICLRDEKNPLMGDTNTERKKAFTKAIVLTGKTRLAPNNDLDRMVNFGRTTALRIQTKSTFYLVERENLANFLRRPEK